MEFYPVESVIHPSNNQGLTFKNEWFQCLILVSLDLYDYKCKELRDLGWFEILGDMQCTPKLVKSEEEIQNLRRQQKGSETQKLKN